MSGGVSAIVLAGGRASRFGGPKLAAPVAGVPLLHRSILAVVAAAVDEVVVVARPGDTPDLPSAPVPQRVIHDPEPDAGPLVGVATGLQVAAGERALVVGGDMPRLHPTVLGEMLRELGAAGAAAVVLAAQPSPERERPPRQSLPMAVHTATALVAAEAAVASGRRSLQALLDALAVVEIPTMEWLRLDPSGGTLDDVDEPADVERLDGASIEPPAT
ncbi:MAG TPA: NTP transferase domain-containing protein [Candidatus Deferrimicrobiaceae bacterium]|nr:NTP transferase domain-containing protein [Candidatus Deferrimicrobiaceae bacterium]